MKFTTLRLVRQRPRSKASISMASRSNYRTIVAKLWCSCFGLHGVVRALPQCPTSVKWLNDSRTGSSRCLESILTDDQEAARKVIETQRVNWRNWNDPFTAADGGPIVDRFHVRAFPSTFVLDAAGIIRAKNQPPEKMDKLVDRLLKELESSGAR